MKSPSKPHPFEIIILNDSLYINAGMIYSFYNPLNFKNVTKSETGPELLELPFTNSNSYNNLSFTLTPQDNLKININLFVTFVEPDKWVPSIYYIPVIKKAWIVLNFFEDGVYEKTVGKTTDNSSIKYETYDPTKLKTTSPYKASATGDNAWNICLIGQCLYIDENWKIIQCIKKHFPITSFYHIWSYMAANTELYNITPQQTEGRPPYLPRSLFYNPLWHYSMRHEYTDEPNLFLSQNVPKTTNYRGYIPYTNLTTSINPKEGQLKYPTINSAERESLLIPS